MDSVTQLALGAAVGYATLGPEHQHPNQLVAAADRAVYEAKRQGRNRSIAG